MASIDYDYIFSNLDTVLGLPLRRRGNGDTARLVHIENQLILPAMALQIYPGRAVILSTCLTFSCLIFPVAVVLLMLLGFCQARTVAG